jgi:hypothetical protein
MDRLGSAINKAIAANSDSATDLKVVTDKRSEQRYIKVRFGNSELYVVPWTACYSWRVSLLSIYTANVVAEYYFRSWKHF